MRAPPAVRWRTWPLLALGLACGGLRPPRVPPPPEPVLERIAAEPPGPNVLRDLTEYLVSRGEGTPACLGALTFLGSGAPDAADVLAVDFSECGGCAAAALSVAPWDGRLPFDQQAARQARAREAAFASCDAAGPDPLLGGARAGVRPGVSMAAYAVARATLDPLVAEGRASDALLATVASTLSFYGDGPAAPVGTWGRPGLDAVRAELERCPASASVASAAVGPDGRYVAWSSLVEADWCVDRVLDGVDLGPGAAGLIRFRPARRDDVLEEWQTDGSSLRVEATGALTWEAEPSGDGLAVFRRRGTGEAFSLEGHTDAGSVRVAQEARPTRVTVGRPGAFGRWFVAEGDGVLAPGGTLRVEGTWWERVPTRTDWDGRGYTWEVAPQAATRVGPGVVTLRWRR